MNDLILVFASFDSPRRRQIWWKGSDLSEPMAMISKLQRQGIQGWLSIESSS